MLPYYIAYALMLAGGLFFTNKRIENPLSENKKKRDYCILFALIWIFLLGLRHPTMGTDLAYGSPYGYLGSYVRIGRLSWPNVIFKKFNHYELGYRLLNKCLYTLSNDPQLLIFVCAVIPIVSVAYLIYDNSPYPVLSSYIYLGLTCFLINFSGLRQAVSLAVSFYAFKYIKKKKPVPFVLLLLCSMQFHRAAKVFILAYIAYHIRLNKQWSYLSIISIPIVYLIREPLFKTLGSLLMYNPNSVAVAGKVAGAGGLFMVFTAVYIFAVIFGHEDDPLELGCRNIFLLACYCQSFSSISNTAMRVGYYYMPYLIILLPRLIYNYSSNKNDPYKYNRSGTIIYLMVITSFVVFSLDILSSRSWAMSNPHIFFWN